MVVESDRWKLAFEYLGELERALLAQGFVAGDDVLVIVDELSTLVPSWVRES